MGFIDLFRSSDEPSDRDLELAALKNLDLPFASASFPKSDTELDRQQAWINQKREWIKTLSDKRVAKAYTHWIDYAQSRLDENRSENITHKEQRAYELRKNARDNEWSRGEKVSHQIPRPR